MIIVSDCKAKENANDNDAMVVINHDVPESHTQRCLFACFYETLGVVSNFVLVQIISFIKIDFVLIWF